MKVKDNQILTVAFFGAKTYPPEIGGIETHIYNLSKELEKAKGINLIIFTGGGSKRHHEKKKNIEIYRVPYCHNKYLLKISMIPFTLKLLRWNKGRIDIYHAHDAVFGFFLSILGFHPLIYTAHGCGFLRDDWPRPIKHILKFMEIMIFKKADKVICVDYKTKEVVDRYREKDTFVIPNGIRLERFDNLPRPREYPQDKLIIFSAGRLIPSKGFQDLIDAYLLLDEEAKEKAELFIAGNGPLLEKLKHKASVDHRIHILGYVPKIEPYFAYADIFVLPSYYEGFPFTLLEAMAAKTACISTDVGDISMRFEDGKEILFVQAKNPKDIKEKLELLIKNEKMRRKMAYNSFQKVQDNYSWKNIANEIKNIYLHVIQREGRK